MTHYTVQQWQAYMQGVELDRASMDDHLFECDICMDMYLTVVEEHSDTLPQLTNVTAFGNDVLARIVSVPQLSFKPLPSKSTRRWYMNTFFHYTLAASLTILLVGSGTFNQMFDRVSQLSQHTEQAEKTIVSDQLTTKAGLWLDAIPAKHMKKEGKP